MPLYKARPLGHIERSTDGSQTIASGGSPTTILYQGSIDAGTGGITYDAGVFTVAKAGTYAVNVYTSLPNGAGARRQAQILRNGVAIKQTNQVPPTTGVWSCTTDDIPKLAAGGTISVRTFQDSGGGLVITSRITIERIA